jgi:hypothetical protein
MRTRLDVTLTHTLPLFFDLPIISEWFNKEVRRYARGFRRHLLPGEFQFCFESINTLNLDNVTAPRQPPTSPHPFKEGF